MVLYLFLISTLWALLRLTIMSIRACSLVPGKFKTEIQEHLNCHKLATVLLTSTVWTDPNSTQATMIIPIYLVNHRLEKIIPKNCLVLFYNNILLLLHSWKMPLFYIWSQQGYESWSANQNARNSISLDQFLVNLIILTSKVKGNRHYYIK